MGLPRFYPVLDSVRLRACGITLSDAAGALLAAGASILQVRDKGHCSRAIFAEEERIAVLCRDADALFVINDRADVARLLAAGVHVGQDDLSAERARALAGPDKLMGLSTHNEKQLRAAEGEPIDYIALGPIFATRSKVKPDPTIGTTELRRLRPLTRLPMVAIGGITRENTEEVFDAGADAVAVVGDLLAGVQNTAQLRARTEEWLSLTNRLRH